MWPKVKSSPHPHLLMLRLIFRDGMMWIFVGLPVLIWPLIKWGIPALTQVYPIIRPYEGLALGLLVVSVAVLPGFLMAFLMLEEKDGQVFSALRILPVPALRWLGLRLSFISSMSLVYAWLCLAGVDWVELSAFAMAGFSLNVALLAPLTALVVVYLGRDKIEGLSLMKGLNFLMILPLFIMVLVPKHEWLLSWLPMYWIFDAFHSLSQESAFRWEGLCLAGALHSLCLLLVVRAFRKKWLL